MVNLLPNSAERAVVWRYRLRLVTLVSLMAALAAFLGGLLLLPSFFLARATADAGLRYADALDQTVGLTNRAGAADTLAALSERVRILDQYAAAPVTPSIIAPLVGALSSSITLTAIDIGRTDTGADVSVTGSAKTRDGLLAFANALHGVGGFSNVSLPVSQLAADTDIPFTISFTFTPTP